MVSGRGFVLDESDLTAGMAGVATDPARIAFDAAPRHVAARAAQRVLGPGDGAVGCGHLLHENHPMHRGNADGVIPVSPP